MSDIRPDPSIETSQPPTTAAEADTFHCSDCEAEYRGGDSCPVCGVLRVKVACEAHPDREAIGRCVVCGRATCDDCRSGEYRACLCPDHRTIPVIEGWAQVYTTKTEFDAQLLRDNLRAEQIDAQIYSQKDRAFSVALGELSIIRLLVPVWEYQNAISIIRDHMAADGEVVFACAACGEPFEPGARQCTECGAALE